MLDAGMNEMRLNFSHGDYAEHGQQHPELAQRDEQDR